MRSYLKSLPYSALWRYFKKYPFLGVDLGSDEIRVVQLEKREKGFHIEKMVSHSLSSKVSLLEWATKRGLRGCSVALALPQAVSIKKQIELPPSLQTSELKAVLRQRLCQYFPGVPENEIYFDYSVKSSPEAWHSITLIATRKEQLQNRVNQLEQAGFKASVADIDIYALARAAAFHFYHDEREKMAIAVLLDFRWPTCTFMAFNAEEVVFHYQWTIDRLIFEEPLTHIAILTKQIRQGRQFYDANHPKLTISCMGVSGDMICLDQLALLLQEQFLLEVTVVDPFQKMSYSEPLCSKTIKRFASRFLLSCGLALRGVNDRN